MIAVGSLAFKRFLDIAALLKLDACVVTDNDGDVAALESKYTLYRNGQYPTIRFFYDHDEGCPTLEPQLLKANSLALLNTILGTAHADEGALLRYMDRNKTDCALKMFETDKTWVAPGYIANAID